MTDYADASQRLDRAEAEFYAAEAMAEIAALPGLRYAPLDAEGTRYGVVKDGVRLGDLVPARPAQQLNGWMAYTLAGEQLSGTFHTAREAAAVLAAHTQSSEV